MVLNMYAFYRDQNINRLMNINVLDIKLHLYNSVQTSTNKVCQLSLPWSQVSRPFDFPSSSSGIVTVNRYAFIPVVKLFGRSQVVGSCILTTNKNLTDSVF